MKKILFILVFLTFFSCSNGVSLEENEPAVAETTFLGEIDWIKNFGGSGEDTAQSVISTSDGGYAVFGFSNSVDGDISGKTTEVNDYWLLKLDAEGNLQWNRTYGGSKDDRGQSIVQTSDSGFAIVGFSQSSDGDASKNEGFHDNWILKLDATGTIEWERSFGFSGHDHSYDLVQTDDGGFFFVGFVDVTASGGEGATTGKGEFLTRHGEGEFWGTKLDAEGNLQWRRFFGGTSNDRAYGVAQANDGGFVIAGSSESSDLDVSSSNGSYDFWAIKITANGDMVWENSYGGTGIDKAWDISKTLDNGYVIVGNTFSTDVDIAKNNGESDVWLVKIDDAGELLWEKTYGGTQFDAARSVKLGQDGGFIISGNSKSNDLDAKMNAGENDFWLLRTDVEGNLRSESSFGGSGLDYGFDALENQDNTIILVGETASFDFLNLQNKGKTDLIVTKIK